MSNADQSASWINSPWRDEYDSAQSVRQPHLEQMDAAPSGAYLQSVLAAENAAIADLATLSILVGPHEQTWKYRWGIEEEISRMSSACRESVGTERESNLRQLRDAEKARREFCETAEFRAATAYVLAAVDRAIEAVGNDMAPAQVAAKGRYDAIRASLEALTAQPSDALESSKERHSEERSSAAVMTTLKKSVILERLIRRYPRLDNDFKRNESWVKGCCVPGKRGYYFFELVEKACISKWGGSSGSELSPLDCFTPQAQLARANRR